MPKLKIKETYLLIIIVIGLMSLAIYSTFALFTASTTIEDVVGITASLDIGKGLTEYEVVTIEPGATKSIELNIANSYSDNIYYGAWYQVVQGNSGDLDIGLYEDKNTNSSSGAIAPTKSISLIVGATNNGTSSMTLYIGVKGNLTNELNLGNNKTLLPNTFGGDLTGDIIIKIPLNFYIGSSEVNTACDDATVTFDKTNLHWKISSLSKSTNNICKPTITTTTRENLNSHIISLAGTTSGTGEVVHEEVDYTISTEVDYKLSQTQYNNVSQFSSSAYSDTSGTTVTNAFTFSNGSWSSNPSNLTSGTFYHLSFNVPVDGNYQLCYTFSSGNANNRMYLYNGSSYLLLGGRVGYLPASTSSEKTGCFELGNVKTSETVKVTQRAYTTIATLSFYLNKMNTTTTHYDTGYRYEGLEPNNYINFNNELWRIIGVFDSSSHGINNTYLTKIIRNDSIGALVYDKNETNSWENTSLYSLLNTNYYNATDGTNSGNCYQYKSDIPGNCDYTRIGLQTDYRKMVQTDVTWYLGGDDSAMVLNSSPEKIYANERDQTMIYSGNSASATGNVGLMYASDYGYSVLASSCGRNAVLGTYNTSKCGGSTWLNKDLSLWALTPTSAASGSSSLIGPNGYMIVNKTTMGNNVRPVLYLKSNVKILSGDGSIENPYSIGI